MTPVAGGFDKLGLLRYLFNSGIILCLRNPKFVRNSTNRPSGQSFPGSVILVFVSSFKIEKNK